MSSPSSKQEGGSFSSPTAAFAQHSGDSGGQQQGESPPGASAAHLGIRRQPPSHVYFNEVFEVEFGLEVARGSNKSPPTNVTIIASLIPAEHTTTQDMSSSRPESAASLVLLEEPRISPSRRTGKLKCKIVQQQSPTASTAPSGNNNNHAFVIDIRTKQSPPPTSTPVLISPVSTRMIQVVQFKLVASPVDWNPIWYKDEGGRDKCMEVTVGLYDINHHLVLPSRKQVSLVFTLCYQSKSPNQEHARVSSQDILKTLGSTSKCNQLDEQGRARVRFRVEDVSKNHQGQDFILKIASSDNGVAPAYTPPVSVRSKRNKRLRNLSASGRSSAGSSGTDQPPVAGGAMRQISTQQSGHQPSMFGVGGEPPASMHPTGAAGPPSLNLEGTEQEPLLREAIQGVTQWADEVVNGLYPLQWHVLGYSQHPDGSPDYSRPYHSMPNPNPVINRVLSMYSDSTRGQLRLIENAIMRSSTTSTSTTSRGSPGGGESPFTPHPGSTGMPQPQQQGPMQHTETFGMMMQPGHPPSLHGPSRAGPPMQMQQPPYLRQLQQQQQQQQGMQMGPPPRPPPPSSIALGGGDMGMQPPPPPIPHGLQQQQPNMPPIDSYRGDAYPPPYHPNYFPRPPRGVLQPSVATPGQPPPQQQRYDETTDPLPVSTPTAASATAASTTPAAAAADAASPTARPRQLRPSTPTTARRPPEDEVEEDEEETREPEVEYILAKQYKSLRTGERLGFPAYSARKEILGFYRESASSKGHGGHLFVPLSRRVSDYEEIERMASAALHEAIESKNGAVHTLRDWGSISNMIDHALVYDWSKDISGASSSGNNRSSSPDM